MYCPLPQYEARLRMGGDPGGVRSRKLQVEGLVTLPIRPQGQIRVAKGWGVDPHAVSRTNGFQDRACSRAS